MFTARNLSAVLYSNLIGQRQVRVSNTDQPEALPEHGQICHWDLILTTLLGACGRFQTKGEIRSNVIRKPMYE